MSHDKYANLIRELITPKSWIGLVLSEPYSMTPVDERETILEAGVKAFDEAYSAGANVHIAQMSADNAMRAAAKVLRDNR